MDKQYLLNHLRVIPDFPVKGINFFDITTLLQDPRCLKEMADEIVRIYADKGITKVAGLESRGFFLGPIVADRLGAGFVPIRKKGKLPGDKFTEEYMKEYGTDVVEMHTGAIGPDDVVLIHDDILATGGTIMAARRLVDRFSPRQVHTNFIIDITDCPRCKDFQALQDCTSLLGIDEEGAC